MLKGSFKTCFKQFSLGHLNEEQKLSLFNSLLNMSEELYRQGDAESSNLLLALWKATGNKRVGWMYRFAKLGVSYRNWQKANIYCFRLRRIRGIAGTSP